MIQMNSFNFERRITKRERRVDKKYYVFRIYFLGKGLF